MPLMLSMLSSLAFSILSRAKSIFIPRLELDTGQGAERSAAMYIVARGVGEQKEHELRNA